MDVQHADSESNIELDVDNDCEAVELENEEDNLYQSVLNTSRYFTSIVELLPAKFYVNQETEDDDNMMYQYKGGKKMKRKTKPDDKKLLAKKAKLLKLDPSQHKTILELQEEVEKKEKELYSQTANEISKMKPINVSNVESTASLEELREKLHAKMQQLRGNRKFPVNGDNSKKVKGQNKKVNAVERKKKLEESTNIKRVNAVERNAVGDSHVKNGSGDFVYSKFDFASGAQTKVKKKKKDLKQLLDTAERKQSKLELLQKTDTDKAEKMQQDISWDRALKKAEGVKLKDDPTLLKRSIKRKEKLKEKSGKKWQDRVETVEKQKDERQKLRKQHIKEKRDEKLKKKTGKKKKKSTPGF